MSQHLITPHGGELVDLIADDDRTSELREASKDWKSWNLTDRQVCDIELISNGGFSPLTAVSARAYRLQAASSHRHLRNHVRS